MSGPHVGPILVTAGLRVSRCQDFLSEHIPDWRHRLARAHLREFSATPVGHFKPLEFICAAAQGPPRSVPSLTCAQEVRMGLRPSHALANIIGLGIAATGPIAALLFGKLWPLVAGLGTGAFVRFILCYLDVLSLHTEWARVVGDSWIHVVSTPAPLPAPPVTPQQEHTYWMPLHSYHVFQRLDDWPESPDYKSLVPAPRPGRAIEFDE